ncbi:DUF3139 domain-containing protein [Alkalicoccobacillus gibsonii]|uniref:DUF3139 domain-containing protein n=1 Tax=Alkalicoccobacillus gibsonii TaxID=79881 RepID=UPI00193364D2|nr:DUF3139 domain-containing protein [Alkalicoccobacillus gibsonii]MBM0066396.1 DUF3139 domain-containing protein [Alkalicoccobacillus gibsonii]
MKKRGTIITIVAIISLTCVGILVFNFFNGSQDQLAITEEKVYEYLTEEQNYADEDIESIRTDYDWSGDKYDEEDAYQAFVTFSDEDQEYQYIYNDNIGVQQIGGTDGEGNHTEDNE